MFKPTIEEITQRIESSYQSKGSPLLVGIKEKIDLGLRQKDSFIADAEAIGEKIEQGISAIKKQFSD